MLASKRKLADNEDNAENISPSKKRKLNDEESNDEDIDIEIANNSMNDDEKEEPNPSKGKGKHTGIVKWFNNDKGFGWIKNDDGSADLFVHQKDLYCEGFRSLADNSKVEFDIQKGNKEGDAPKAINVTGPNGAYCTIKPKEDPEKANENKDKQAKKPTIEWNPNRCHGKVKWYKKEKGFGLIENDEVGNDLFVHQSEIQRNGFRYLEPGQTVEFDIEDNGYGKLKAIKVIVFENQRGHRQKQNGRGRGRARRGGRTDRRSVNKSRSKSRGRRFLSSGSTRSGGRKGGAKKKRGGRH